MSLGTKIYTWFKGNLVGIDDLGNNYYSRSKDFKDFKDISSSDEINDDLNYSFLTRTFSSLSKVQKDKILQILNNTSMFEKVG